MPKYLFLVAPILLAFLGCRVAAAAGAALASVPATRAIPVKERLHGVDLVDPYRWLEDAKSPDVQAWMKRQDDFARSRLSALPERAALEARLKELSYLDTISAPRHRKGRYFYVRRHADREKAVVYWKEGKDGAEKVLLDPNGWSKDGSASLGGWTPSWDGKKVAFQKKANNSDEATLYVLDVATGKTSDQDVIEGSKYASPSWTPAGDGFYYTWLPTDPKIPASERPGYAEVRLHLLGTDPKTDRVVHPRTGDPTTFLEADLSRDGRWLFVDVQHGWTWNEVKYRNLERGTPGFLPLAPGTRAHFRVEVFRNRFYVLTDDGAPRWRVYEMDPARPARADWKEIVPERPDAKLEDASILGGRLALTYLRNASSLVEIRELDGSLVRQVPLPGLGTVGGVVGLDDEDEAYFSFGSFTVPDEIYQTSIGTGKTDLYARVKVPVDPSPYEVEQVSYPSRDGTKVNMFIVHRKGLVKDGSSRLILYGYGGFQISLTPTFSAPLYPWLERGGVFAVPSLRGGGEFGEDWHKAGMLLKKQNVFDDFIAAAEWLVREKYTSPSRLVIRGGSNGGLLVGAAMTQRPDLFSTALCAVPLLDMVRYHLFGSGKTWISEYGSADDLEQFKAIMAYSPYQHVKAGTKYPATLLLSADSDDRVDPMHARKFAAALQAATTGGPVLLRIERNAGHGGADMIKAAVESRADEYAFALAQTAAPAARAPATGSH